MCTIEIHRIAFFELLPGFRIPDQPVCVPSPEFSRSSYLDNKLISIEVSLDVSTNLEIDIIIRNEDVVLWQDALLFSVDDDEYCPPEWIDGQYFHRFFKSVSISRDIPKTRMFVEVLWRNQVLYSKDIDSTG